ncbi:4'-phosphopantetheinyl transferase family protein [Psychroserpens sp.]|uniref:4'-phosphopantetheinyl transferase family protein n=1 Tax=Psychroserpens sp. TaxID=2020870 RepID=UPI001B2944C9|nr:4'-phosphopantetheinyl transferase superfamily protein [Psychroserpens sp.]MBO6605606.1 4'-phosphopantetheinyl transferase superfamily protein [Psychroserpens sp.]MBO6631838.1 4'-phosphopantetheinyl transferase superfamily protein [Psychroserpens sp.]MBO6653585.1 4'-phosphopantetheinyl transferase superfamily protein [Psychroserpens sp.]MBO6681906.1 4'-phosphopantetheinyl transferase superfamily protein [Psychroserpens sp.]MBO6748980.1 4'-phosphopantetheinyl transferase superfamily protein 
MPLYKTINPSPNTVVKIWKITESYEDLIAPLNLKPNSLERVLGMKSELHQRGFLSVRHLLRDFGYTDQDLYYDAFGKPHLKDGKYISITHSFIFSGVIISDEEVGIDIEKQREKIAIIAKKFVDYEFNYLSDSDDDYVRRLTVIWGIKESLYKLFATPGMLFREHFLVIPFILEDGHTMAWIDYQQKKYRYNTHYLEFEGFTCAFVTN